MTRRGLEQNLYTRKEPFDTLVYLDFGDDYKVALMAWSKGFSQGGWPTQALIVNGQIITVKV